MIGLKLLFFIGSLIASSHAFWWARESAGRSEQSTVAPPMRQYPISYIRAFAYHPVAFPQPLAPITTYHVSRNPQTYNPNRNTQVSGFNGAVLQAMQQQLYQNQEPQNSGSPSYLNQPSIQQQLPQNPQVDFGPPPTTTTTTTTTTPAPPLTQPPTFSTAPPISQTYIKSGFAEPFHRQSHMQQPYQSGNFGGFPQYYSPPYSQPFNQYPYGEGVGINQFSGRLFGEPPAYQQYSSDPMTYQFIPTSITPIPNQNNNVKFVPCMCPVAVSISPSIPEKRSDEIPILSATAEPDSLFQSSTQQSDDESK